MLLSPLTRLGPVLPAGALLIICCCSSTQRSSTDAELDDDPPSPEAEVDDDERPWTERVVYLTLADRFFNGDPTNDELGAPGCFDPDHPRRFHGGDLAGVIERAGYLEELGVGALWLTPLYRQVGRVGDSCGYHGYWPDLEVPDDGAMEPRLGTEAELEQLIGRLDAHDMELVIDLIVNHAGYGATIEQQRPEWFHPAEGCAERGPPEVFCPVSGLPDFAQERPEVRDYLIAASRGWLERFEVGGVRMDTAKHVPLSFLADHWIPAARRARPGLFLVAEVFAGGSPEVYRPFFEAGFDGAFDFALYGALLESFARDRSVDAVATAISATIETLGEPRARQMVTFLDNHDLPRFATETLAGGAATAPQRYRLALVALLTLPGVPQLYFGDELGLLGRDPDHRRDMPSWAWDAEDRVGDHDGCLDGAGETFALTARLAELRRREPALARGRYLELWRQNSGPNLLAFYRWSGTSRVVVAINAGATPLEGHLVPLLSHPGLPRAEREALSAEAADFSDQLVEGGEPVSLHDGALPVTLPPRTAAVLVMTDEPGGRPSSSGHRGADASRR